jgi:acyl-coenzyme A synthetase/AMP-(fatty) acid ligase
MVGVPTTYAMLCRLDEKLVAGLDLSRLQIAYSAGAPLPNRVRTEFGRMFGCRVLDCCGITEAGLARARHTSQSHQHHQHRMPGQRKFIVKVGPPPDAVNPGFHCVRTRWIRGFMAFWPARRARTVRLTVPM